MDKQFIETLTKAKNNLELAYRSDSIAMKDRHIKEAFGRIDTLITLNNSEEAN